MSRPACCTLSLKLCRSQAGLGQLPFQVFPLFLAHLQLVFQPLNLRQDAALLCSTLARLFLLARTEKRTAKSARWGGFTPFCRSLTWYQCCILKRASLMMETCSIARRRSTPTPTSEPCSRVAFCISCKTNQSLASRSWHLTHVCMIICSHENRTKKKSPSATMRHN